MGRGFTVVVCRACEDPPCLKACPTDALRLRKGGGVLLDPDRCLGCGRCREACLIKAVFWTEELNKPLICIHCGTCSKFCPYGVLKLMEKEVSYAPR
jgi:Fe-S-cluster-containing dehydrogenase component